MHGSKAQLMRRSAVACAVLAASSAAAQSGQLRYRGSLWIGDAYAPAGISVHVIAADGADRILCGSAATNDRGHYDVAVAPTPGCIARTVAERRTLHIFVVRGENAGHFSSGASLDEPRSLRPMAKEPRVADIPGIKRRVTAGHDLVGVRYYGRATPSAGEVRVEIGEFPNNTVCGVGAVAADGSYWLDIAPAPPCIAATHDAAPLHHNFFIGRERVARVINGASLDLPRSLGQAHHRDARMPAR